MKTYIWMGGTVLILVALMYWGVKDSSSMKPHFEAGVIHSTDHVAGLAAQADNSQAEVIVVQYSDFECPACRSYYLMMREMLVQFGDRVAFVYRHFPLNEIHRDAELAARAAEAAGKQGKFWEMHDLLYEKQNEWSGASDVSTKFESYARLLSLNIELFKADIDSKDIIKLVRAQRQSAIELGLQATPSFFINGRQIQNPASVEEFKSLLNQSLAGN